MLWKRHDVKASKRIARLALRKVIRGREICSPKIHGALMQLKAGENVMSKGQKSNKETKKVPAMTAKEKKAAKKAKKNERGRIGE
ncbi:MAG: hypothetical protein OEQ14_08105 [Gammaproteobacteria bacterium]|nr:hypothetical protein [Gammaproteobacteria bacterium]